MTSDFHIFTDKINMVNNKNIFNINKYLLDDLNINNIKYVIIDVSEYYNIKKIIDKYGFEGIPVLSNIYDDSPNVIYYNDHLKLKYYTKLLPNYFKFKKELKISFMTYYFNIVRNEIVCIVPIWGRHKLLFKSIESLKKQNKEVKILGIVSNDKDEIYCNNILNIKTIKIRNKPLGRKFCFGIEFCKIFYPKGVIIVGSDDMLTSNYVSNIIQYLDKYDFIGLNHWAILENNKLYKLRYTNKNRTIGSGRLLKYTLLNKAKWILYDEKLERELDNSSDKIITNNKVKKLVIYNGNFNIYCLKEGQEMISSITDYIKSNKVIVLEK